MTGSGKVKIKNERGSAKIRKDTYQELRNKDERLSSVLPESPTSAEISVDEPTMNRLEGLFINHKQAQSKENMQKYDIFEYVIPSHSILYKGSKSSNMNINYQSHMWLTTDTIVPKHYGNTFFKFVTLQDLKLVNIQSHFFHMFIMDYVNSIFNDTSTSSDKGNGNDNDVFEKKMEILFPLGLPNYESQKKYYRLRGRGLLMQDLRENSVFFNSTNRISFDDNDRVMAGVLSIALSKYGFAGYIAPSNWPSTYHSLSFHSEICLFNPSQIDIFFKEIPEADLSMHPTRNSKGHLHLMQGESSQQQRSPSEGRTLTKKQIKDITQKSTGGSKKKDPLEETEQEVRNKAYVRAMRLMQYDGEIEYDTNGNVIVYNDDFINAYKRKKIFEKETGTAYPENINIYKYPTS